MTRPPAPARPRPPGAGPLLFRPASSPLQARPRLASLSDTFSMTVDAEITLVLFDIDGTLLDVHGAGRQAFVNCLATVFDWKDSLDYIRFDGSTDLDILRKVLARHGVVPNRTDEEKFFRQLPLELDQTLQRSETTLHPGVRDVLEILGKYPHVLTGLVTGNIESCARLKLEKFGLHGHFLLGAFGHEHADRGQIAGLAMVRARQQLQAGQQIKHRFLIGDTPSDIMAASAIGARSIAVATGRHNRESLEDAGADHVLDSLADVDAVLSLLRVKT